MMLAVLPAVGVAQAVMVLVGQHLGNKRPDLAEEASGAASGLRNVHHDRRGDIFTDTGILS